MPTSESNTSKSSYLLFFPDKNAAVGSLAGLSGGIVAQFIGYPFLTYKVRLQQRQQELRLQAQQMATGGSTSSQRSVSLFRSIYNGVFVSFVSYGVFMGIRISIIDYIEGLDRRKRNKDEKTPLQTHFIAGCLSGFASSLIYPVHPLAGRLVILQQQKQLANKSSVGAKGTMEMSKKIWKHQGFKGFYTGYSILSVRDTLGTGIWWMSFCGLKDFALRQQQKQQRLQKTPESEISQGLPAWKVALAGGFAGQIAFTFIFPSDVALSRFASQPPDEPKRYSSVVACYREIYREGGLKLFARGYSVTLLRAFPVNAVLFPSIDFFRNLYMTLLP